MLKHLFLNRKKIPVPVPVRTLAEALKWVNDFLISDDKAITKIELDGEIIDDLNFPAKLTGESRLFVQVDSPIDLSIQTIDALRNLVNLMHKDLNKCAVEAWQSKPQNPPTFVSDLTGDLDLILAMINHVTLLMGNACDTSKIRGLSYTLDKVLKGLDIATSQSDWRAFARLLMKELDPNLSILLQELSILQQAIINVQSGRKIPTGTSL